MPAPVALRSQYSDLYGSTMLPALQELFVSELQRHPMRRDVLFKQVSTENQIYQATEFHDLDLFNEIAEGEEFTFKRGKQGSSKTFTVVKYGLGFSISEEMMEDGKFNVVADMVRKLARSGKESQEISGMNIFNNGFASETSADGQPVFDTQHPLPSGLSFRNELASAADLSTTSLDTALVDMETQQIGDSGIIYDNRPKYLLVPSALKRTALEIVGSTLKADVSTNNLNPFLNDGLIVISSPHITDTDSWYLTSEPENTGLRVVVRKPLETKASGMDLGFATDAMYWKARYREDVGVTHPYGIYGSPGA